MELAKFRENAEISFENLGRKMPKFPLKTWVPVRCIIENYTDQPCDPVPKSSTAIQMVTVKESVPFVFQARLYFHSVFILAPVPDFGLHLSKPASGPEFPAPLNLMLPEAFSLRPLLSRHQHVPAVYMYFPSLSCSLTVPPPPLPTGAS